MKDNNVPPIRLSPDFIPFLEKAQLNRIKSDIDKKTIGNPRMSSLIVKYFKLNNDRYLELINMEEQRND